MRFINLEKFDGSRFDEDTGAEIELRTVARVNVAAIRCYYGRRDNKPGSRITFTDGGGFAVADTPEQIDALLAVN